MVGAVSQCDMLLFRQLQHTTLSVSYTHLVTSVYHNWQQEGYEETYENVPEFCYSGFSFRMLPSEVALQDISAFVPAFKPFKEKLKFV